MPIEKDWRQRIYRHFSWPPARFVIACDPDGLLRDEEVTKHLSEQGFTLEQYDKSISFLRRWRDELRPAIEEGSKRLILNIGGTSFESLPEEMQQHRLTERFSLTLGDLFLKLTLNVLSQLDISEIDRLYVLQDEYGGVDDRRQTCAFLLDRFYKLNWRAIANLLDLLRFLLPFHYRRQTLPQVIIDFLMQQWTSEERLADLPLREMLSSAEAFYAFLQTQWDNVISGSQNTPDETGELEFCQGDIQALLENLFTEGKLLRRVAPDGSNLPAWTSIGIIKPEIDVTSLQIERLYDKLTQLDYAAFFAWQDWLSVAMDLGALLEASIRLGYEPVFGSAAIEALHADIDRRFSEWLSKHYYGLCTLPYLPMPVMSHHVLPWLSCKEPIRKALLVLDGMSFIQWPQIERKLQADGMLLETHALFSWIPTITEISRRALFSGVMPRNSFKGLEATASEENQFREFWSGVGLRNAQIQYERGIVNNTGDLDNIPKGTHVLACGIAVNFIDNEVHKTQLGFPGIWNQVKVWLDGDFLSTLIKNLVNQGYDVILTSDHGHRESIGKGTINDGVLAGIKGERVRIFCGQGLRELQHQKYKSSSVLWDSAGLPSGMYCLLAEGNSAFIKEGETSITHGGMSLMETVVPFAQIHRKGAL